MDFHPLEIDAFRCRPVLIGIRAHPFSIIGCGRQRMVQIFQLVVSRKVVSFFQKGNFSQITPVDGCVDLKSCTFEFV